MNLFQKAKQLFNRVIAAAIAGGADRSRLHAGRALVGHRARGAMPIGEWLQRWMGPAFRDGFARATKRDERGGYRRRATTTKTVRRVNYRKVTNALRRFNGSPAKTFRQRFRMEFGVLVRDPDAVARVQVL